MLCRGRVIITRSRVQYNEQLQLTVSEPFGDESEPGGPRMQHVFVRRQVAALGVSVRLFPAANASAAIQNIFLSNSIPCTSLER